MYEYKPAALGGTTIRHEKGTYFLPGETTAFQWPLVTTEHNNISCRCYQNAPREEILRWMVPKAMEIHVPGDVFVCNCTPQTGALDCPEEVHQGTDPKDPWRQRRCQEWRENWEVEAANIIGSEEFRDAITENVLDIAGITGWKRLLANSAEFVQVLEEREKRGRAIKIAGGAVLALSAGVLTWRYLKKRKEAE